MTYMLKDLLDWEEIFKQPRYAGGHLEVLEVLFKGARVLMTYHEDDYTGEELCVYKLEDGRVVLLSDGFGSCSGCDSWDDSTDEEARNLCIQLANNAKIFGSVTALAINIANNELRSYAYRAAEELLPELWMHIEDTSDHRFLDACGKYL